jgi:chemotaxis protein CheD
MTFLGEQLPLLHLKPGEAMIAESPSLISTVLGSCVSVTLYSPRLRAGGICHGVLPTCELHTQCDSLCPDVFKYVQCSVLRLIERFEQLGLSHGEIEARVFGGSDVLSTDGKVRLIELGRRNVEAACQSLSGNGVRLLARRAGGKFARKLYFFTHTGEVLVKRLGRSCDSTEGCNLA